MLNKKDLEKENKKIEKMEDIIDRKTEKYISAIKYADLGEEVNEYYSEHVEHIAELMKKKKRLIKKLYKANKTISEIIL